MRHTLVRTLLALTLLGCGVDQATRPDEKNVSLSEAEKNAAASLQDGFSLTALGSSQTCPRSWAAVSGGGVAEMALKVGAAPRAGAWTKDQPSERSALAVVRVGAQANHTRTHVNVSGGGVITDPDDNAFPVRFAITAAVANGGSAVGHINFHFSQPFGQAWGAVPADRIHLDGRVTAGEVLANETVVLEGMLTEREYVNGEGVVFLEENVPFRIAAGGALGAGALTLTWCLLPEFQIQVTSGTLRIH